MWPLNTAKTVATPKHDHAYPLVALRSSPTICRYRDNGYSLRPFVDRLALVMANAALRVRERVTLPLCEGQLGDLLRQERLLLTELDRPKRKRVAGDNCSNPTNNADNVWSLDRNGRDAPANVFLRSLRVNTWCEFESPAFYNDQAVALLRRVRDKRELLQA